MFICNDCNCCQTVSDKLKNKLCCDLGLVSVKSRLEILLWLSEEKHCVCNLEKHTKLSQSLISHHLSDLAKAGLVEAGKSGRFSEYKLTKGGEILMKNIKQMLEGGE